MCVSDFTSRNATELSSIKPAVSTQHFTANPLPSFSSLSLTQPPTPLPRHKSSLLGFSSSRALTLTLIAPLFFPLVLAPSVPPSPPSNCVLKEEQWKFFRKRSASQQPSVWQPRPMAALDSSLQQVFPGKVFVQAMCTCVYAGAIRV